MATAERSARSRLALLHRIADEHRETIAELDEKLAAMPGRVEKARLEALRHAPTKRSDVLGSEVQKLRKDAQELQRDRNALADELAAVLVLVDELKEAGREEAVAEIAAKVAEFDQAEKAAWESFAKAFELLVNAYVRGARRCRLKARLRCRRSVGECRRPHGVRAAASPHVAGAVPDRPPPCHRDGVGRISRPERLGRAWRRHRGRCPSRPAGRTDARPTRRLSPRDAHGRCRPQPGDIKPESVRRQRAPWIVQRTTTAKMKLTREVELARPRRVERAIV